MPVRAALATVVFYYDVGKSRPGEGLRLWARQGYTHIEEHGLILRTCFHTRRKIMLRARRAGTARRRVR